MLRQNALRLWREELDELLEIDLSTRGKPLSRFSKYLFFIPRFRTDRNLKDSLQRIHGNTLKVRDAVRVAVAGVLLHAFSRLDQESREMWLKTYPWLNAVPALPEKEQYVQLEEAISSAFRLLEDLESGVGKNAPAIVGDTGDTGKKSRVAVPREDLNLEFCKYLAKKRKPPESIAAEALNWLYRECKVATNQRKNLTKADRKLVESVTRSGQRWCERRDSK
jgi:hypothetical protein